MHRVPPPRLACPCARVRDNLVLQRACLMPAHVGTAASNCVLRMQTHQITPARMPLKNACFPLSPLAMLTFWFLRIRVGLCKNCEEWVASFKKRDYFFSDYRNVYLR